MAASPPPTHRAYTRHSAEAWNEHKDTIRELFLEQDKTYEGVAAVLKTHHGFEIGVRQLKRWTDKWGFFRNIPDSDMGKMARTRQRRQQQLGRPTKFMRKHGAGEFQEVPATKLDAYQKRIGTRLASPMSQSSGLPSNIIYRTPSGYASSSHAASSATPVPRSAEALELEFNNSTERVFSEMGRNILGASTSSSLPNMDADSRELMPLEPDTHSSCCQQWLEDAFDGNYQAAAQKLEKRITVSSKAWVRASLQFCMDVMEAASYPGCPQSLNARVTDILSRSLIREREKYSSLNSDIKNESELRKVLIALKVDASFWGPVVVQQRVLQIWEPILGRNHQKMMLMRDLINDQRTAKTVNLDSENDLPALDGTYDAVISSDAEGLPELETVQELIHLGDGPADRLLEQLQVIENPSVSGQQIRQETAWLRLGRSRALLGVYYSFIRRFEDAEKAFLVSEMHMEHETCVEIKLHRTLWYAEHKTRVGDWEGVRRLMCRAHEVFMANDTPSEFIVHHFPERFLTLCTAVSAQLPIDKIIFQAPNRDLGNPGDAKTPDHDPEPVPVIFQSLPAVEHSVLSPSTLFPPTPMGVNSEIDIDAWRQFVHYSSPQRETPAPVVEGQAAGRQELLQSPSPREPSLRSDHRLLQWPNPLVEHLSNIDQIDQTFGRVAVPGIHGVDGL